MQADISMAMRRGIEVELHRPAEPRALLFCLPGGGMTRGYFTLGGDGSRYNFAAAMVRRGFAVALADQPGTGSNLGTGFDGDVMPADAAERFAAIARELAGELGTRAVSVIGVGHSMGGVMIVMTAAAGAPFDGLILLGSNVEGLPEALLDQERPYAGRPGAFWPALPELARQRRAQRPKSSEERAAETARVGMRAEQFAGENAAATALLSAVRAPLYTPGAIVSMMPGALAASAAAVRIPVLLVRGEHDIGARAATAGAAFTGAPCEAVELEGAGHNHFVTAAMPELIDTVTQWFERSVLGGDRQH